MSDTPGIETRRESVRTEGVIESTGQPVEYETIVVTTPTTEERLRAELAAAHEEIKRLKNEMGMAASELNVKGQLRHRIQIYKREYGENIERLEKQLETAEQQRDSLKEALELMVSGWLDDVPCWCGATNRLWDGKPRYPHTADCQKLIDLWQTLPDEAKP